MSSWGRMPERGSLTILYGSQTGQAKAIAEEINDSCTANALKSSIFCLSLTDKKFCINEETCVVFVVSTTGDGEPPDTVRKFFRRINKKTLANDYLQKLRFGFLALGDSNYTNFCNCGKGIEKRLLDLGAQPFYPTGYADDAVGLELVVEPWIEGLWPALHKHLGINTQNSEALNGLLNVDEANEKYLTEKTNRQNKDNKVVDKNNEKNRRVQEVSLDINASKMEAVPNEVNSKENIADDKWNSPSEELTGKALKIPLCPAPFLELEFHQGESLDVQNLPLHNNAEFPASVSEVKMVNVIRAEKLTTDDAVKTALELEIDIKDLGINYEPGDTFGIVCPNDDASVKDLLARLGLENEADLPVTLKVQENTAKKNAAVPEYIPLKSTLRDMFTTCIDIKAVPKKALIRMLIEYTKDDNEKRRLQELCSAQGAKEYMKFIREPYTGLVDVLKAFPSCNPPVQRLLEHLPRLQARAYSVSSSPLQNKRTARFVFNITVIKGFQGVTEDRTGLCTGWLDKITSDMRCKKCNQCDSCDSTEFEDLGKQLENISLRNHVKIPVYWRRGTNFKLPEDESVPVIMIGPGTGVAPFMSFLAHREMQSKMNNAKTFGQMILFFGCRHKERDFLYRKRIESFLKSNTLTNLFASFSRDENQEQGTPKYVQDNLKLQKDLIMPLITDHKAVIYICGDAKNMARSVHQTFVEILESTQNMPNLEAMAYIKKLRDEQRYLEDIWT